MSVTEDEWLKLLGRVPNFHAVADLDSLADRIMQIADRWDRPLEAAYPGWTSEQLRTAADVYAGAIAAAGAAGDLDAQLRIVYSAWNDSAVETLARRARWPEDLDPAVAERLAADTRPLLVDAWHSMRQSIYIFGNPFIGAQVSIVGNWFLDEEDLQFTIDSFAEHGYVAQHISPQGAGADAVLVLYWLGDHILDAGFDWLVPFVGGLLLGRLRAKGKAELNRIDVYQGTKRVASYEIREPEED